jgi:hypothetical protein
MCRGSPGKVQGSAREVTGNPGNDLGTPGNLQEFSQAIQVKQLKLKPMLSCQDNWGKARRNPRKSEEAQERPRKPRRQLYK